MRDAFGVDRIEKSFRWAQTFRAIELSGDAAGKARHLKTLMATRGKKFGSGKPAKWPKRSMSRADYETAARAARVKASATRKAQEAAAQKKAAAPKETSTRWGPSNRQLAWIGGGAATAAGGTYASHRLSKSDDRKKKASIAAGAVAGAGAAAAADEAGGWAAKRAVDAYQKKPRWTEANKKTLAQHRDRMGLSGKPVASMTGRQKNAFFEKYPTNVPGGRARRVLAVMNRPSVKTAVLGTGAVAGGVVAASKNRKQQVSKGLPSYLRTRPSALLKTPYAQAKVRRKANGEIFARNISRSAANPPVRPEPRLVQEALFVRDGDKLVKNPRLVRRRKPKGRP